MCIQTSKDFSPRFKNSGEYIYDSINFFALRRFVSSASPVWNLLHWKKEMCQAAPYGSCLLCCSGGVKLGWASVAKFCTGAQFPLFPSSNHFVSHCLHFLFTTSSPLCLLLIFRSSSNISHCWTLCDIFSFFPENGSHPKTVSHLFKVLSFVSATISLLVFWRGN